MFFGGAEILIISLVPFLTPLLPAGVILMTDAEEPTAIERSVEVMYGEKNSVIS